MRKPNKFEIGGRLNSNS